MKPAYFLVRWPGRIRVFTRRAEARGFRAALKLRGISATIEPRGF
jgi:hypothetical protein